MIFDVSQLTSKQNDWTPVESSVSLTKNQTKYKNNTILKFLPSFRISLYKIKEKKHQEKQTTVFAHAFHAILQGQGHYNTWLQISKGTLLITP